jgi:hypothetical protein
VLLLWLTRFPSASVSSTSSIVAEALFTYQGRSAAELSFEKGAVITNVAMLEGPWWKGNVG